MSDKKELAKKDDWYPDIVYMEGSKLPSVNVPFGKDMPGVMYFGAYFDTGETEPGIDGNPVPIVDMDIYQYFCYNRAKSVLDPETLDKVRVAFGLQPLKDAEKAGRRVMIKVEDAKSKNNSAKNKKV